MGKIHEQMTLQTKQKLQDACIHLMEERGIHGVSVQALTSVTGLNRGTFYLHYTDKFDLLSQIQERLLVGLQNCLNKIEPLDGFMYIKNGDPYPAIIQMFTYFGQEANAFKVLLGPNGDPSFSKEVKTLYKNTILKKFLKEMAKQNTNHFFNSKENQLNNYFLSFMTSAIFGVIEEWLANDAKESPEEMGKIHLHIIQMIRSQLIRL